MSEAEKWRRLIAMIRDGEPLPQKARDFVADVLELVSRGEDPRERAGTAPKDPRADQRAVVGMHYWLLRAKHTRRGSEAGVRAEVAKAWGLSADRVKAIARNCNALKSGAVRAAEMGYTDELVAALLKD